MWITLLQRKIFQEITYYPFLVDQGFGLPTSYWCHISQCSSCLHPNQALTSLGCVLTTQPQPKEPWISLFDKFDGTHSKFKGFVNQMCLASQLHLHQYLTSPTQVGFINNLLSCTTLAWFHY